MTLVLPVFNAPAFYVYTGGGGGGGKTCITELRLYITLRPPSAWCTLSHCAIFSGGRSPASQPALPLAFSPAEAQLLKEKATLALSRRCNTPMSPAPAGGLQVRFQQAALHKLPTPCHTFDALRSGACY